jgi:hypothetical protein
MSMTLQTDAATNPVSAFWSSIRGMRRRDPAAAPAPAPCPMRRDAEPGRRMPGIRRDVAESQQATRRQVITAEGLLDSYIKSLRPADYAFRLLKDEFDELCAEAEIAPVSDKRVAHWLRDRGHKRYRDGWPKVTMYKIGRSRRKAA